MPAQLHMHRHVHADSNMGKRVQCSIFHKKNTPTRALFLQQCIPLFWKKFWKVAKNALKEFCCIGF